MRKLNAKSTKITYLSTVKKGKIHFPRLHLASVLLILALLYFTTLFLSQYWRLVQLRQTLQGIEQETHAARLQNEQMLQEIERLYSPAYLEKMARQELGMVRAGELLFFFRETDNPSSRDR
jgi:cell division protein DivIC